MPLPHPEPCKEYTAFNPFVDRTIASATDTAIDGEVEL